MPIRTACLLALTLIASAAPSLGESPGDALLARSIDHHDPLGLWGTAPLRMAFDESRPDGSVRHTRILIDLEGERFEWSSQRGKNELQGSLIAGICSLTLNGSTEISDEDQATHRLDCDRIAIYRDYYTYLWGLPMKLRDPGTVIDPEVADSVFDGRPVKSLRVTYDPEVGSDIWYFYFDPESAAVVGYRFFHDESANDGEYILLEDELAVERLRLPKTRSWYTNTDERLLGADSLVDLTLELPEQGLTRD